MEPDEKPYEHPYTRGFGAKVSMWEKRNEEHVQKQKINPFSEWDGASHRQKLQRDDPNYGTPVAGSKTDIRGRKAGALISNEVVELCGIIYRYGESLGNGTWGILFGELFEIYTRISNKLVGMMMRARKHGLIQFEGEMLFQRRDDHVMVVLVKLPPQLQEQLAGGPPPNGQGNSACSGVSDV